MAGLKTIIVLSFVSCARIRSARARSDIRSQQILAIGFLLVILSSALFQNYLTLLVVATYVLAPVPNWLCGKASNRDDFMDSGSSSVVELGRFMTGFMVVMGVGEYRLPSSIFHTMLVVLHMWRGCVCRTVSSEDTVLTLSFTQHSQSSWPTAI